ncbi:O-antigen translocase [Parabacteroides sp. APC149_11_2_Y6]
MLGKAKIVRELLLNFLSLCRRATKADIVKVFSFTAISTLVKMLTGLISVKVVASIIGPAGVALLGQLNNFASIAMTVSSGGINSGITKYVAEYKEDEIKIKPLLSTALRITVYSSLVAGILMIVFHSFLSEIIMLSDEYGYVFVLFGITILLYALNMMLISILNGFKEFQRYVKINIANSILGLLFTLLFVLTLGLKGALVSTVTYQSVMLLVTLWMIRKLPWLKWSYFKRKLDIAITKKYFRYTLMTLTTAATVPVSQMLLRGYVISEISAVEAGWWEAMNRISNMYLMVITSSFSVYYLPRLSELNNPKELRHEIFKSYKVIVPMLLGGFVLVYFLRTIVIRILFTPEFLPMENLFVWQLLGDFFKICSWLLAFLMVAKSMTKTFVATEIIFALTFVGLGFLFMHWNGVVGITQGYMVNYVLYMICMMILFRKIIFFA